MSKSKTVNTNTPGIAQRLLAATTVQEINDLLELGDTYTRVTRKTFKMWYVHAFKRAKQLIAADPGLRPTLLEWAETGLKRSGKS